MGSRVNNACIATFRAAAKGINACCQPVGRCLSSRGFEYALCIFFCRLCVIGILASIGYVIAYAVIGSRTGICCASFPREDFVCPPTLCKSSSDKGVCFSQGICPDSFPHRVDESNSRVSYRDCTSFCSRLMFKYNLLEMDTSCIFQRGDDITFDSDAEFPLTKDCEL